MDLMVDLSQKLSGELLTRLQPAYENYLGVILESEWMEPWVVALVELHAMMLMVTVVSRRHLNFQFFLFLLAFKIAEAGIYFSPNLNQFLSKNWKSFSNQNNFDPHGLFLAIIWSGPLLVFATIITINTFVSLCYQIVEWKRAERAMLARAKQD